MEHMVLIAKCLFEITSNIILSYMAQKVEG